MVSGNLTDYDGPGHLITTYHEASQTGRSFTITALMPTAKRFARPCVCLADKVSHVAINFGMNIGIQFFF